jgi:hypothetical protein
MSYRRPGQRRGSPHQAIIPGDVYCPDAATLDLEPVLGDVEDVRIVETLRRPVAAPPTAPPPELDAAGTILGPTPASGCGHDHCREVEHPPPQPEPALWLLGKVPVGERPYWGHQLLHDRAQSERRLLRRAASLHVVQDANPPPLLIFPHLASPQPALVR